VPPALPAAATGGGGCPQPLAFRSRLNRRTAGGPRYVVCLHTEDSAAAPTTVDVFLSSLCNRGQHSKMRRKVARPAAEGSIALRSS